jgi:hypothetical protein
MAYAEHTSVAGPSDVIDRIVTLADSAGWTVHRNSDIGGLRTATIGIDGVTDYVHIYNIDQTSIRMRISVGYDGGLTPADQPEASRETLCHLHAGPYPRLFVFARGTDVWASVAIARSGEYRHLTFGLLDKIGAYTGGTYIDASDWGRRDYFGDFTYCRGPFLNAFFADNAPHMGAYNGRLRIDTDDRENFFYTFSRMGVIPGGAPPSPTIAITDLGIDQAGVASASILHADKNAFSGRSIFHPLTVYIARTGETTLHSPVGLVDSLRICSMDKFEPEQEVTVGGNVYVVFPMAAKRPMFGTQGDLPAGSGMYGYAVRKVA